MSVVDAVVVHSGGMDSSLCLALAVEEFGADRVLSLSFSYGQRHSVELAAAKRIAKHFGVRNVVVPITALGEVTENALMNGAVPIEHAEGEDPNTLVVGRNGLMVRLAAIHAAHLGARCIYVGIIGVEAANSGYRDCTRAYMDLMEEILRIDLDDTGFEVRTPVVAITKEETMKLGHRLGVLQFLLAETITCYEGLQLQGCRTCPACKLRNEGLRRFLVDEPGFNCPFVP